MFDIGGGANFFGDIYMHVYIMCAHASFIIMARMWIKKIHFQLKYTLDSSNIGGAGPPLIYILGGPGPPWPPRFLLLCRGSILAGTASGNIMTRKLLNL